MKNKILDEIETSLQETRSNLLHWVETAPEEKRLTCLGLEDETCIEEHLHVIDESLEKIKEGTLGVCTICHEAVETQLLQMDYTSAVCLGHFTDAELRQLEAELELSQVVQRGLLPRDLPSIHGLNIAAFSRPAQIIGGDYFDFMNFKDGAHGIVMADVSGHGVSAGMFMSSLQTAFHTLVPDADSPISVLERINRLYIHNINFTTFVTTFLGKYDPQTRILSYANAGHNSAYLYRMSTDEEFWLRPTGPAIGLVEKFTVYKDDIKLEPGDILLLYTDGITEAANQQGILWGEDRLADIIRGSVDLTAEQIIQNILKTLKVHTDGSPFVDDVTLVVARVA
ncbi:MAG: SpoIIE family protein phosphatase [Anaerolineales bacterium]|nr:SpoIIE family protein phosphatase [Anaerolineales bacterium]